MKVFLRKDLQVWNAVLVRKDVDLSVQVRRLAWSSGTAVVVLIEVREHSLDRVKVIRQLNDAVQFLLFRLATAEIVESREALTFMLLDRAPLKKLDCV